MQGVQAASGRRRLEQEGVASQGRALLGFPGEGDRVGCMLGLASVNNPVGSGLHG